MVPSSSHHVARAIPLILWVAALSTWNCSSPTAPGMGPAGMQLANPLVMLNGESVNGMTISSAHLAGGSTFFQATLTGPNGPALGETVQVRYRVPNGPGMMSGPGLITLHDDGTHGDPTADDGAYCFEDTEGRYGFHMPHAPFGQYHYEFFGIHHDGRHTNHMEVAVTIVSQ